MKERLKVAALCRQKGSVSNRNSLLNKGELSNRKFFRVFQSNMIAFTFI